MLVRACVFWSVCVSMCACVCVHAMRVSRLYVCVCVCVCAEANEAAVAAKGGIEAVVSAMRRHEGVAEVARLGSNALWNIAMLGVCSAALFACLRARVWLMAGMHARAGARGGTRWGGGVCGVRVSACVCGFVYVSE